MTAGLEARISDSAPGVLRWAGAFAVVLALHAGLAAYLLAPPLDLLDGAPNDAIDVELMPNPTDQANKPDEVAGPSVDESAMPTSEQTRADDPTPPAPDSPPPTDARSKPDLAPEATAPPAPADATATLPPPAEKPAEPAVDRPPDPKPAETTPDAKTDNVERKTAPSQASNGSAALLGGGHRPSAAAQATWRGAIGTHLVRLRRYPPEARTQGWQGTARVRVTIDADGHVLGRELVKSTGRPPLDVEALALMQRSDPFPKPPSGLPTPIVMTVPVNFAIH